MPRDEAIAPIPPGLGKVVARRGLNLNEFFDLAGVKARPTRAKITKGEPVAARTIKKVRATLAMLGLPDIFASDAPAEAAS